MTYVDKEGMEQMAGYLMDMFYGDMLPHLSKKYVDAVKDNIVSVVGRFTGLRFEDGKERIYDVQLIEGEPYVYDN